MTEGIWSFAKALQVWNSCIVTIWYRHFREFKVFFSGKDGLDWPDSFNRTHDFRLFPFAALFPNCYSHALLLWLVCLHVTADVARERDWIRSFLAMMDHGRPATRFDLLLSPPRSSIAALFLKEWNDKYSDLVNTKAKKVFCWIAMNNMLIHDLGYRDWFQSNFLASFFPFVERVSYVHIITLHNGVFLPSLHFQNKNGQLYGRPCFSRPIVYYREKKKEKNTAEERGCGEWKETWGVEVQRGMDVDV